MIYSFTPTKIKIYVNSNKKSLAQIKQELGCDVVINGGLYNMNTFKPVCHLKVDGKVLAADKYKYWGFAWNTNDTTMKMVNEYSQFMNYISCVALCKDRKAVMLSYGSGVGGKRGRSAIGVLPDGRVIIYCTKDGTSGAITPENLQKYVVENGWKDAVMLDSGGSSQCITPNGNITSTRRVHNVICFWLSNKTPEEKPSNTSSEREDTNMNGASVKVYSKAKNGSKKLSTNFTVKEFACNDGTDPVFVSPNLVTVLQKIRTHFGKPVTINSGYRTPSKNKAVSGATYSQHLYGMAADIVVSGKTPKEVAAYAETLLPNKGGIGIYSSFTHIDVRATKSRWNG